MGITIRRYGDGHAASTGFEWMPIHDFIEGAESDVGLCVGVSCPQCHEDHRPTITKLGYFIYACQGQMIGGRVSRVVVDGVMIRRKGGQ